MAESMLKIGATMRPVAINHRLLPSRRRYRFFAPTFKTASKSEESKPENITPQQITTPSTTIIQTTQKKAAKEIQHSDSICTEPAV